MLLSIFFFILAGLAEIGGGYLVWLYMRDDKVLSIYWLVRSSYFYTASSLPSNRKQASVKFTQPTVAYLSPSPSYGVGSSMVYDQTHMISSAVSYVL